MQTASLYLCPFNQLWSCIFQRPVSTGRTALLHSGLYLLLQFTVMSFVMSKTQSKDNNEVLVSDSGLLTASSPVGFYASESRDRITDIS